VKRHPLGYTKINLATVARRRIRLHWWHAAGGSERPHNHRWPFIAIPLAGTFTDTRWTLSPGAGHHAVETIPPGPQAPRSYQSTGATATLTATAVHLRRPLRPYRCRVGDIHSFAPVGRGPHVSLVFLGAPVSGGSTVWAIDDEREVTG
jgi:hypothetical protein